MAASDTLIVLSANPQGKFVEGLIKTGQTPKPGTCMQIDADAAQQHGRDVWELFDSNANGGKPGGPLIILDIDRLTGKTVDDAYAAESRAFGYIPLAGDELNLRIADISGTVDMALGTVLVPQDGTGLFVATAGSPELEVALTRETSEGDNGEQLVHSVWSGY